MNDRWKLTADGWVRVPRVDGRNAVTFEAGQVRGSAWRIGYRPSRGRAAEFQDGWHQAASGTGRRVGGRTPSLSR